MYFRNKDIDIEHQGLHQPDEAVKLDVCFEAGIVWLMQMIGLVPANRKTDQ